MKNYQRHFFFFFTLCFFLNEDLLVMSWRKIDDYMFFCCVCFFLSLLLENTMRWIWNIDLVILNFYGISLCSKYTLEIGMQIPLHWFCIDLFIKWVSRWQLSKITAKLSDRLSRIQWPSLVKCFIYNFSYHCSLAKTAKGNNTNN